MRTRTTQAGCAPNEAYKKISEGASHSVLLETLGGKGRSFAAADPFLTITANEKKTVLSGTENKQTGKDPLHVVESKMKEHPGSWAFGYLSYDYARRLETLPETAEKDIDLPVACFMLVERPLVFEKSQGQTCKGNRNSIAGKTAPDTGKGGKSHIAGKTAPNTGKGDKITSNMTRDGFEAIVKKAREHIKAGDVYQVDLSQRFSAGFTGSAAGLYSRLRTINPSPFSAYLDFGGTQIASSSPERLIRVSGRTAETRPIAGTKKRSKDPAEDRAWAQNLKRSAKERAEHIMMVDLARNDLGKVCEPGSVHPDELMAVEKYSHVQHIVSNVKGTLAKGKTCFDALRAIFPGGTITGAPKIRAMEIIEELEPVRRNIYTGSIGYFAPDGSMDFNIAIRTMLAKGGRAYFQTGAGIVYDSNPRREYLETIYKAQAMMEALGGK